MREETLQIAVARLGGGAQGLQMLMDHVNFWASSEPSGGDVTAAIRKGIADLCTPSPAPRALHSQCLGAAADRGAAYTRALRKSHILRQRGHHSPTPTKPQCRPQWRPSAHHSWVRDLDPELGDANNKVGPKSSHFGLQVQSLLFPFATYTLPLSGGFACLD